MQNRMLVSLMLMGALSAGCGGGGDESTASSAQTGKFSGTLADKAYEVDVNCSYFDTESFTFRSDKTDVTDTNGDGLIISGFEMNGKFSLTIVDSGTTYSIGNLASFTKGDNSAEGAGRLTEEGTANMLDVAFTVSCP